MSAALSDQTVYTFFRLGLVTGLLPKDAIFIWVDRQILARPLLTEALIELSLAARLSYSQVAHLLNIYQEGADIDLPVRLLLAHAACLLRQDPSQAERLTQALCLLNAEYYLAKELRLGLTSLEACLHSLRSGKVTGSMLAKCLRGWLRQFSRYEPQVQAIFAAGGTP